MQWSKKKNLMVGKEQKTVTEKETRLEIKISLPKISMGIVIPKTIFLVQVRPTASPLRLKYTQNTFFSQKKQQRKKLKTLVLST